MNKETTDSLILDIREKFEYQAQMWREIREEAAIDMRYVSGDPWDPKVRKKREDAGRQVLSLDELNQYLNQLINDVRQNKREINAIPKGNGANDQTAELRTNLIRQIQYKSNAQAAYSTGFEGAAQRSYGFWRINTPYVSDSSFDQELAVRRIPNPDTVYYDWDCKEFDGSDAENVFALDFIPKREFARKYPNAETQDFTSQVQEAIPTWVREKDIQIAEFWSVKKTPGKLFMVDTDKGPIPLTDEELKETGVDRSKIVKRNGKPMMRKIENRKVIQYITNGLEILEQNDWAGKWIPIIPCFGKELYLDLGAGSTRQLMSLIRLARDPYMLYCYLASQEGEEAAMTPRAPFVMYEGQEEGHEDEWQQTTDKPTAYLLVKPTIQGAGNAVLPLPTRPQFEPNFQQYEVAKESAKRAIQAAVGMYNSSVGKHDTNAKSGVAIKALDSQSEQGSFHFIDNYERALEFTGRVMNDLCNHIYDTERDISTRAADDTQKVIRINTVEPHTDAEGNTYHHKMDMGDHDVTISTGPSYESQREEAQEFVQDFIKAIATFPVPPPVMAKLLSLAIKLKDLGPIGDEMSETISPPDNNQIPPQAQQQISQMQQQLQVIGAYAKKLEDEQKADVVKNQFMIQAKQMDNATKVEIAEITTKAQDKQQRDSLFVDLVKAFHQAAHEAATAAGQQQHEQGLQQSQQDAAMQQAAQVSEPGTSPTAQPQGQQ